MRTRPAALGALLAAGVILAGCGDDGKGDRVQTRTQAPPTPTTRTAPPADLADEQVIRRWADTLRRGDVAGAARVFALPVLVQLVPTGQAVKLTVRADVQTFNRLLPCGARVVRTERRRGYAVALFALVERPGATCDAPGGTARTAFRIEGGKITEWRRLADEPGDGGEPGPDGQLACACAPPWATSINSMQAANASSSRGGA